MSRARVREALPRNSDELTLGRDHVAGKRRSDPWVGLSPDVIARFSDVLCSDPETTPARRRQMVSVVTLLDAWLQISCGFTLLGAAPEDLYRYIDGLAGAGLTLDLIKTVLTGIRRFYSFAAKCGFRDDNPAEDLLEWLPADKHESPQEQSEVPRRPVCMHGGTAR